MITADVVVVGAGPAGLAAAAEAGDAGADVLVLDENERPGGQIYRQLEPGIRSRMVFGDQATARRLLEAIKSRPNIRTLCGTTVWGVGEELSLVAVVDGHIEHIRAGCLIICTGAHDRAVPFPGWTLPGVISAGAALTLLKGQRILPGRNVLLAGAGPIQLVLAKYLIQGGARIAGLLDASSRWALYRRLPRLLGQWALLREGMGYLKHLRAAGVRIRYGHTILRAEGDDRVRSAVITRVDERWRPVPGGDERVDVDAVICGFGFVPSTHLTTLLGCDHRFDSLVGGWVAQHDADMATSVPNVLVAGETTGIAGGVVACEEGRVAGITAARRLRYLTDSEAARRSRAPRRRLAGLRRFRRALDEVYEPREGLLELPDPDTVICRCEGVTTKTVLDALTCGARRTKDVKLRTRAGMGPCQGRMCATSIGAFLGGYYRAGPETTAPLAARPPIKPVPLSAFTGETRR